MAKIIRIRLYRVQDYDLYALYYDKKHYHLSKMCLAAVSAFANGRPLPVFSMKDVQSLPKPVKADNGEVIRSSGVKFTLIMSFSIPDYDTKTIALMECLLKDNTANSFVKTLVRRCFTDMEYMYLDETHRALFPDPGHVAELVPPRPVREKVSGTRPRKPAKAAGNTAPGVVSNSGAARPYERQSEKPAEQIFPHPEDSMRQTAGPSQNMGGRQESAPEERQEETPAAQPVREEAKQEQPRSGLFSMIHDFEM